MDVAFLKSISSEMKAMTNKANKKKRASSDYHRFQRDVSLLIYIAIPHGKKISFQEPSSKHARYELSHQIHRAVQQIMSDVLTEGKACWQLVLNSKPDSEIPFFFQPECHAVRNTEIIPMIIRSRDIGIPAKRVRSLVRRLKHSEMPLSDLSLLRFNDDRERIANRWGHVLSWHMSDPSTFTDPFILLSQCDKRRLAIKLCEAIEDAMNDALSKSRYADCAITIPTYSREELESSKLLYLEGKMGSKEFKDLIFSRI